MKKSTRIILGVIAGIILVIGIGTGVFIHQVKNAIKTISEDLQTTDDTTISVVQATVAPTAALTEPGSDQTTAVPSTEQTPTTEVTQNTVSEQTTVANSTESVSSDPYDVFNKAVMLSTATSLTYNRTAGKASFTPNVINTFFDETDIAKQTSTGLTYTPVLAGISKEDCVGESMTDSGETVTLVFNLKSVTVPASSSPAQNGYIFFMDSDMVLDAVHIVIQELVYEKNGEITLTDGVITAVIDKTSDTFRSLSIRLHESYYDEVSKSFLENKLASAPSFIRSVVEKYMKDGIYSTFDYDMTANYGF